MAQPVSMNERLCDTINRHDLEAFADCFASDYQSEQPAHPRRAFKGRDTVRHHWSNFFRQVPDFQAELVRTCEDGETEWAEWRWHGTQVNGEAFDVRGVVIIGVRRGCIVWSRPYMEPVEMVSTVHEAGRT